MNIIVQETFQNTIQGEGYWTGLPVDFIRLYGCPVGCPWCDTGYSNGGGNLPKSSKSFKELIGELKSPTVVISGGEPFIHKDLSSLAQSLLDVGKRVHIETSGVRWQPMPECVWITLSPKEHISPRYPVDPKMWDRSSEVKIVIDSGEELKFYEKFLPDNTPVFLQPEWNNKDVTVTKCLNLISKSGRYLRLSLQTHKMIGAR